MGTLLYRFQEPDHLLLGTLGFAFLPHWILSPLTVLLSCPPPPRSMGLHRHVRESVIHLERELWLVGVTTTLLFGEGEPLVLLQPYLHWPADLGSPSQG